MENEYLGSEDLRNTSMDDVLEHHGVLGMKWGVRNADTLRKYNGGNKTRIDRKTTFMERAKTRISKAGKEIEPVSKRQVSRENSERGETDKLNQAEKKQLSYRDVKNPKDLTDEQLSALNDRMQKEINFNKRKAELANMNKTKGEKRKEQIISDASEIGRDVIKKVLKKKLEDRILGQNGSDGKSGKDKNSNTTQNDQSSSNKKKEKKQKGGSNTNTQTNQTPNNNSAKRSPINVDAEVVTVNDKNSSGSGGSNLNKSSGLALPEAQMATKKVAKVMRPVQNAIQKTMSENNRMQSNPTTDYTQIDKYMPTGADYIFSKKDTPLSYIYDKKK